MKNSFMNTDRHEVISEPIANEHDTHWEEVMNLAEKHGFIRQASGGTAILVTHENVMKRGGR